MRHMWYTDARVCVARSPTHAPSGTDPTDAESTFTADIRLENGVPVIGWSVTNNVRATYTVQGTSDLSKPFTAPTTSAHRFFRVIVTPK